MKKLLAFAVIVSFLSAGAAFAADAAADKKAECAKKAAAEKVAKEKMDEYMKKCTEAK